MAEDLHKRLDHEIMLLREAKRQGLQVAVHIENIHVITRKIARLPDKEDDCNGAG